MLLRTLISEKTVAQRKEASFPEAVQSPGSTPGLKTPAPCTYAQFSFHRSVRCKKECSVGSTQVPMPDLSRANSEQFTCCLHASVFASIKMRCSDLPVVGTKWNKCLPTLGVSSSFRSSRITNSPSSLTRLRPLVCLFTRLYYNESAI